MNSDDMDDPDLRAAIAASLRGSSSHEEIGVNGHQHEVVDLTADSDDDVMPIFPKSKSAIGSETDGDETDSDTEGHDDEDEDLKRAIELSMQGARHGELDTSGINRSSTEENNKSKPSNPPSPNRYETPTSNHALLELTGFLGLNRKQMELERLARLKKRKPEDLALNDQRDAKHSRTGASPKPQVKQELDTTGSMVENTPDLASSHATPTGNVQQTQTPSPTPSVQFPEGAVKKTWAFGCRRQGDDIKLEEVLQKSDLHLAVLSSFMWEMDWLFSKLDTRNTRFILVMQAKDESTVSVVQSCSHNYFLI
jgi:hypothetical protein